MNIRWRRVLILAVAAALAGVWLVPAAAQASALTVYKNDFEQGLAGSPPEMPIADSTSTLNGTTWGLSGSRAASGSQSIWCAGDPWSIPVFTSDEFDESKALQVRVTYLGAGAGGNVGDVDAAISAGPAGLTRLEAEDTGSGSVTASGSWTESAGAKFSGGSTMTSISSGSRITFVFAGDPDASQTVRRVMVLAGRIDRTRGVVSVDVWQGSAADPTLSSWSQVVFGQQVDESVLRSYPPNEAGRIRFPVDLRGLASASLSFAAYVPAGGLPYLIEGHQDFAGASWSIVDRDTGTVYVTPVLIQPASAAVWETQPDLLRRALPPAAIGHRVWLQFFFYSSPNSARPGIFIDDVNVTGETFAAPDVPALSSTTNPDQNNWVSGGTPSVSWSTASPSVTGYSWSIDHSPYATPPTSGPQVVGASTKTLVLDAATLGTAGIQSPLPDGEWYVHVAAERPPLLPGDANWSAPGNYRLRIDNNAPTISSVSMDLARTDSVSSLGATVRAADSGSGIAKFIYAIGTSPGAANVRGWTTVSGAPHLVATGLKLKRGSRYYMTVRAYDQAGLPSAARSSGATYVRLASSVSLALSAPTVTYGSATRATGAVSPRQRGVTIQVWRVGNLVPIASGKTNILGKYSVAFRPLTNGTYWVKRLPDAYRATSRSANRKVAVAFKVVATWRKAGPGGGLVSGSIRPAGLRFARLQVQVGTRWVNNPRSFTTDANGNFSLMSFPATLGKHNWRVRASADADHVAGVSKSTLLVFP
jgi:hypothetical protein